MKPYGTGLKPIWTCGCCRRDERKSPRAAEKAWAEELIDEGREELDQRVPLRRLARVLHGVLRGD